MTEKNLSFGTVSPELLETVWPNVVPMLAPAVDMQDQKFDLGDIRAGIENGMLVLWVVVDDATPIAAITTRIVEYPLRQAMVMDWLGGSRMAEWLDIAMPKIKQFAVANGCLHLEAYGRKGWGRVLSRHNWKQEYVAYRMDIGE